MSFMVYGRELYRTSPFLGKSFWDGSKPIFDYTIGGTKVYFHAVWVFTSGHQWAGFRLAIYQWAIFHDSVAPGFGAPGTGMAAGSTAARRVSERMGQATLALREVISNTVEEGKDGRWFFGVQHPPLYKKLACRDLMGTEWEMRI